MERQVGKQHGTGKKSDAWNHCGRCAATVDDVGISEPSQRVEFDVSAGMGDRLK